jgi:transposase
MYTMCMPKRLSIQPHLSRDELERRYRAAKAPGARSHWQIIWLLTQGLPSERAAAVTGYTVNWGRSLAQRYNQTAPAGLGDQRHRNPGRIGLLSMAQRAAFPTALAAPPPDGGIWTGAKAAAWMAATLGHPVHPQRGWVLLRRLGWMSKVPRPRHAKADPEAQAAFNKPSRQLSRRPNTPARRMS